MVDLVAEQGVSLPKALERILPNTLSNEDKGFVKALSFGTLRWYFKLDFLLGQVLNKPLKKKDSFIKNLALVGLFQLTEMQVAPHAAVSETVNGVGRTPWAKNLLNAVLRNFQRQQDGLLELANQQLATQSAHPQWLVKQLQDNWPQAIDEILANNNQQAPMALRVNRLKCSRDDYLQRLEEQGIAAQASTLAVDGIILQSPIEVTALPGFKQGDCYIQDIAAQRVTDFLDLQAGQRMADLCAAPGGKAIHALERCPDIAELVALDIDDKRLQRVAENSQRCGVSMTLKAEDAADLDGWWDGTPFERVLVDTPCSGTGVIRRHPDIKLLRRASDIPALQERQRALLEAAWQILAVDGILLYSTCSLLAAENTEQICAFLQQHPDAESLPIVELAELSANADSSFGSQILTGTEDMDGFFYARLRKTG